MITLTHIEIKDNLWINSSTPNQIIKVKDLEHINVHQFKSSKLALQTKLKTRTQVMDLQKLLNE